MEQAKTIQDQKDKFIDRCWKIAVTATLYVMVFREEILRLFDLWKTPKESHGFLIPAFSLYFLYQDRRRLKETIGKPSYLGLAVILASLAIYLYVGAFQGFYYVRQVAMISLLVGTVLMLGGWPILKIVWLPVAFLIFAMPLPSYLYTAITMPLRALASSVAAVILDILPQIRCQAMGVVIEGAKGDVPFNLNVAEACSGMRLLLAFVALGVAMAYLEYRPVIHRLILVASTIPIAVLCNIIRVLITGLIHIYIGAEYATGTLHTVLGMVMLVVAFGLYGALAGIMNKLYIEDDAEDILVVPNTAKNNTNDKT